MFKPVSISNSFIAVILIFHAISCTRETRVYDNSAPQMVSIPGELIGNDNIKTFIIETESEINQLTFLTKQLIAEYTKVSEKSDSKNNLVDDVKKATLIRRINAKFAELSEIYGEIELQTADFESQLNTDQKSAFNIISNQLKNKIDTVMITFKSFEKESKNAKIIFF